MEQYQLYIDGEWTDSSSGETFIVLNPYTEEAIAEVSKGCREDTQKAIDAAHKAFESGIWSDLPSQRRYEILLDIAERLESKQSELVELETRDAGMTTRMSSIADIPSGIGCLRYYAELARTVPFYEGLPPMDFPTSYNFVLREPIGVCGQITPWNVPFLMAISKLAPALAAGNTVVLKPASNTPLTALELARIIDESDMPKGVVNVVTGSGSVVGEEIASNSKVDKASFTGSTEVGRRIMELSSNTIKKVTLELGGKSPVIVLEDANHDLAIDGVLYGVYLHSGQVCVAGTRLFLPDSIHDEFVEKLVAKASRMKLGDPMDWGTDMGPLVSAEQRDRVEGYIESGLTQGAKLACGGARPKDLQKGYFIEPTIFVNVKNEMRIAQEEIFGPVLSVIKYSSVDEAIEMANDTIYGLAGAVWSEDIDNAMNVARKIRSGTVWINEHHMIDIRHPFGGYKQSGIGREMGVYGFHEYTEVKHVYVDLVKKRESRLWYGMVCSE
ncbi:MAG: aldehyde dehydrogenase family protein [Thermodesulfobacteriota bacterium]|nr:aldehyde dehydrogenase family protein [Thermodesulfobacteriota bacterium]